MKERGNVSGQPEEFFGPFSVSKMSDAEFEANTSVSWPNLAISMRNAKSALRNADAESPSSQSPPTDLG